MQKKSYERIIIFLLLLLVISFIGIIILGIKKNKPEISNVLVNNKKKELVFESMKVRTKYQDLVDRLGKPTYTESDKVGLINSVTWQSPLDEYNAPGKYSGVDYIRLNGHIAKKYHPIPAVVFIIVGKYMNVPEHLLGPLKHASETINIEQLFVPKIFNDNYGETGEKEVVLVTGSCASITISSITVKFVEDMIEKYKNETNTNPLFLYEEFRNEYDSRVQNYLCGGGIVPEIDWFSPEAFGEVTIWNGDFSECSNSPSGSVNNKNEKFVNNNVCGDFSNSNSCPPSDCAWEEGECVAA